jgi:hypothetical protein
MKRISIALAGVALLVSAVVGLSVYQYSATDSRKLQEAKTVYSEEFNILNDLLIANGFAVYDVQTSCDPIGEGMGDFEPCYRTRLKVEITDKVIAGWPKLQQSLDAYLAANGWVKAENYDPVTQNPVNSLDRLLEYKGVYPADVSYSKNWKATCGVRFEVVPYQPGVEFTGIIEVSEKCLSSRI